MTLRPDADLQQLFFWLRDSYGHQPWWPAETRFEILVGAVLVQNTAWANVERAIAGLRQQALLSAQAIVQIDYAHLEKVIRPSGYFRIKAERLKALCRWFLSAGEFDSLAQLSTGELRESLLAVKGVGPETADAILLYAFDRPVFVIDAYTRRLLNRLGWLASTPDYDSLRAVFELTLPADATMFAQYHALIVEHAKALCRARPRCAECSLQKHCDTGR